MKFIQTLLFVAPLLLVSCRSVKIAPTNVPGIIVAQDEVRDLRQGQTRFPAGLYKAEVVAADGTYYKAPTRLKTLGVLIGRSKEGGIFVSNAKGNPQAAWYGDPRDDADERPATLFGAVGMGAPKLWKLTPRIPYTVETRP